MSDVAAHVAAWWGTSVSRIEPGVIELRGRPVQDLIGTTSLVEMIWLLLRGDVPDRRRADLLEAALVAGVDHGPQAPSIAAARMAATCGVGLNNAVATGINLLGDTHGGAGQQCAELLGRIRDRVRAGAAPAGAVDAELDAFPSPYIPGYGHRFHPVDPRRDPLLSLVDSAVRDGVVEGGYLEAAKGIEAALAARHSRPVPLNIDAATAVIYCELGFVPPLCRGLFVLSRSVGVLAHAWEETQQGRRIKGPIPPDILPAYLGPVST